jgi:predicted nucleic acid-binding protein
MNEFLETSVNQITVTQEIAKEAGLLRLKYGKSHGIRMPDALIAATASVENKPVVSLDKKHFSILTDELIILY